MLLVDAMLPGEAVIKRLMTDIEQRAKRLRQAILKHGFSGKLVSQSPTDELESAKQMFADVPSESLTSNTEEISFF